MYDDNPAIFNRRGERKIKMFDEEIRAEWTKKLLNPKWIKTEIKSLHNFSLPWGMLRDEHEKDERVA